MKTFVVHELTEGEAREVISRQLQPAISKLVRKAHAKGALGRPATVTHEFTGPLFDAAARLPQEFEETMRSHISEAWNVHIGHSLKYNAPNTLIISLK